MSSIGNIAKKPERYHIVNSLTDLPAPIDGTIYLEKYGFYFFCATIETPYNFDVSAGGIHLESNTTVDLFLLGLGKGIIYTGSGPVFQSSGDGMADILEFRDIDVIALDPDASLFNITQAADKISPIHIMHSNFLISNGGRVIESNLEFVYSVVFGPKTGFYCTGSDFLHLSQCEFSGFANEPGCIMFTLDGNCKTVAINGTTFIPETNEYCFYFDPTVLITTGAVISHNNFNNGSRIFAPGSKTQTDLNFKVTGNIYLPDSTITAGAHFVGAPYSVISLAAQNAKTLISVSGWTFDETERITTTVTGIATYVGYATTVVSGDANLHLSPDSGTNQILISEWIVIERSAGQRTVTFTNGTDVVNETATPRVNGDTIIFKNSAGTLPAALSKAVVYFVVNKSTDSFQLAYTDGGAAILFADDGSGTNSYETIERHGSEATASIDSATKPIDLIPQALLPIATNDEICLYVANTSSGNAIRLHKGYYRIKK